MLFVGQTAVWEPLVVALGYLGIQELRQNRLYGDVWSDASGDPLYVGTDAAGRQVYTLGAPHPWLVSRIVQELQDICWPDYERVETITIGVRGQRLTRALSHMATWTLIGGFCHRLLLRRVNRSIDRLFLLGQELGREYRADLSPAAAAAKPLLPEEG